METVPADGKRFPVRNPEREVLKQRADNMLELLSHRSRNLTIYSRSDTNRTDN